jgi:hypothetical protein
MVAFVPVSSVLRIQEQQRRLSDISRFNKTNSTFRIRINISFLANWLSPECSYFIDLVYQLTGKKQASVCLEAQDFLEQQETHCLSVRKKTPGSSMFGLAQKTFPSLKNSTESRHGNAVNKRDIHVRDGGHRNK